MVRPQSTANQARPGGLQDPRTARRLLALGLLFLIVGWRLWNAWQARQAALAPQLPGSVESGTTADASAGDRNDSLPDPTGVEDTAGPVTAPVGAKSEGPGDRPNLASKRSNPGPAGNTRLAPPGQSPGAPPQPGGDRNPANRPRNNNSRPSPAPAPAPANTTDGPEEESQIVRVRRVVDGDTLLLKDGTRVRMIGIDTPETKKEGTPVQPFGPEASEYTKKFCEGGTVRLVFDGERHDDYGRLLAHVYLEDRFLSEELIRLGLARVLYRHPYSDAMKDRFRAAENAAKREKKGIWSLSPEKRRGGESSPEPSYDF